MDSIECRSLKGPRLRVPASFYSVNLGLDHFEAFSKRVRQTSSRSGSTPRWRQGWVGVLRPEPMAGRVLTKQMTDQNNDASCRASGRIPPNGMISGRTS
jgi:hypothetical protein